MSYFVTLQLAPMRKAVNFSITPNLANVPTWLKISLMIIITVLLKLVGMPIKRYKLYCYTVYRDKIPIRWSFIAVYYFMKQCLKYKIVKKFKHIKFIKYDTN